MGKTTQKQAKDLQIKNLKRYNSRLEKKNADLERDLSFILDNLDRASEKSRWRKNKRYRTRRAQKHAAFVNMRRLEYRMKMEAEAAEADDGDESDGDDVLFEI